MSVLDNVKISFSYLDKYNFWQCILRMPKYYREEKSMDENAEKLLKIFGLLEKKMNLQ